MSDETTVVTQPDSFGRHWVYVTDAQVRSHAKGRFSLRNRLAYLAALFVPMIFLIRFFSGASGYGGLLSGPAQYYDLCNALGVVGGCFYLFEGDRAKFIFRRRYRSYRAESLQK